MNTYTNDKLIEHTNFGEYNTKGTQISPPHPQCPFCKIHYYNDEYLFKHMNEEHFMCQLCKDKKNIIFYKEIPQLVLLFNLGRSLWDFSLSLPFH
jgi:hypothetical protein